MRLGSSSIRATIHASGANLDDFEIKGEREVIPSLLLCRTRDLYARIRSAERDQCTRGAQALLRALAAFEANW